MNRVERLVETLFSQLTAERKLEIESLGASAKCLSVSTGSVVKHAAYFASHYSTVHSEQLIETVAISGDC